CRELGIDYPVFSVGFGMGAGPELAAAVSNAGGFGVLGGDYFFGDLARRTAEHVGQLTVRPFGVNFIIPGLDDPDTPDEVRAEYRAATSDAIDAGARAIVLFWGDPRPFVDDAHQAGAMVFIQVGSVEEAKQAAEAGVDAAIV